MQQNKKGKKGKKKKKRIGVKREALSQLEDYEPVTKRSKTESVLESKKNKTPNSVEF